MNDAFNFFNSVAKPYGTRWNLEEENRAAAAMAVTPRRGDRILEIGCGNGRTLQNLPSGAYGIDYSLNMLLEAKRRFPTARLIAAEGERLPVQTGMINTVVAVNSLHNQSDPKLWLNEIRRLRPGRVYLDIRNALNPVVAFKTRKYRPAMERAGVFYKPYSLSSFIALLESLDFEVVSVRKVHRPLSEPGKGFRLRNIVSGVVSRLPAMAMSYLIEARPSS